MRKKIRVGILFGGKSAEHEVSLMSAKNVLDAIDKDKYDITLIGINKNGYWLSNDKSRFLLNNVNPKLIKLKQESDFVVLVPQHNGEITNLSTQQNKNSVDIIFPVLHGPFGEDGTMQGLLKLINIPFVGPSILGSAVCMDKDVTKRLLRDAKIPIAKFVVLTNKKDAKYTQIKNKLGLPLFIKPANMGSSVGVSKIENEKDFKSSLEKAFEYDRKIIVEEFIDGREIECAILGNEKPIASVPGEVIVNNEFYSYETKYIDESGASLSIPADIPEEVTKKIQKLAIKSFKALSCEGMSRVDFFLKKDMSIIVNEINTIPGFTSKSMYPMLWNKSGVSYTKLIDKLIQLAIKRFKKEQLLETNYSPK